MIFLDTSAIYALADSDDENHDAARSRFATCLRAGETFLIHNYVAVESAALLQRRLGFEVSVRFLHEAQKFETRWVDQGMHEEAVSLLEKRGKAGLSLVDVVSFIVMRKEGVKYFLGFDEHFEKEGFLSYFGSGT